MSTNITFQDAKSQNRAFEYLESIPTEKDDEIASDSIILIDIISYLVDFENNNNEDVNLDQATLKENFILEISDEVEFNSVNGLEKYLNKRYENVEALCVSNGLLSVSDGMFKVNPLQLRRMLLYSQNKGYAVIKKKKNA